MLLQCSLSVLCALLALAAASPAPVSPSGPAKLLLSHSQRLPLATKYHLSLLNTRFGRHPVGNIFKSLHKRKMSPGPIDVSRINSLDAFRQAHDTVRRAHEIGPRERTMTRPEIAILAGFLADHHSIQSKTVSQTKFSGRNTASITHSLLQNSRVLRSKLGQYVGRKAAPLGTSKDFAGLFRTSLPTANRMGLTGDDCTGSSECADGRICLNTQADTCSAGEDCLCVPSDGFEPCTSSPDCSTAGEVCVQLGDSTVCLSEETANALDFPIVDAESSDDPVEAPASNSTDPDGGSGDGITGTICTSSSECADGRICVEGSTLTCPAGETCFCAPADGFETCTSSADCSTVGEVCVQLTETRVCLSEEVANDVNIPIVDSSDTPEESPTSNSTDPDGGSGDGITGAICTSSLECANGRICTDIENIDTCSSGETCLCLPSDGLEACTSSADCLTAGEVCVQLTESAVCFSEETATDAGFPIVEIESSGTPEETPANEDADSHGGSGDGITGSTCTCSSGCTEGRFCTNGNMITCPAGDSCICIPSSGMQVCSSSAECLTGGEVCARVINLTLCLSEEVAIAEGIPILDGVRS